MTSSTIQQRTNDMKRIVNPDVKNEDPEYWERVLESHGLGIRQLKLSEDDVDENTVSLDELKEE